MNADQTVLPILRTKLHRPRMAVDFVPRPHMIERLNQNRQQPLTLISAPAGYGKTTLISSWLESQQEPSAWVSLDEDDNHLYPFLSYVLAAFQSLFPTSIPQTEALLATASLPPVSVLAHALLNELNAVPQPFILVLDDYHFIQDLAVNDLLTEWLRHPPQPVHLVIVTRLDPPLPLHRLRARGQMTEIRTQHLRFTQTETVAFLLKT